MLYRFDAYELDEEAGELRRDGRPVAIQPKPFALLALLVRERARVVPSDEILETLWPGVAVTPGSLTRAVSHARRAIGDTHRGARIRSAPKRGYRFVGAVLALDPAARTGAATALDAASAAGSAEPGRVFVGRADALARLRAAWADAAAGSGSSVLVTGPPGIGKTRLVEVFAAEAQARGALALVGRAREGEGVPALWLWAQVLRRLADAGGADEELRELAVRSPELARLLPELALAGGTGAPDALAPSPEQSRFLLFDGVVRVLARASRRRPLLLLLEDLQWAGSAALRLLEHLVCETAQEPLLILATVRDEQRERGHPLAHALAALRQSDRCSEIALRGLTRAEVGALLAKVIGRPAPADLTSELFARTEGVPLFLREAIRLLVEQGVLEHPDRIPRQGIALPARALELIRRSLDVLSPGCARLVAAGAVLGREFAVPALAEVAEVERSSALDGLEQASRAGVIEPAPDDPAGFRFVHALFQEAAYAGLGPGERARLHLRAARLLERQHEGDPDRVAAELAHHHCRALAVGDPERAYEAALRAAERASRLSAWEQAATHYEQAATALEHAPSVDPERRLELLLALGEALRLTGERGRRRGILLEAMQTARSLGRPRELARAAIAFVDLQEWGVRDEQARAALDDALATLAPDAEIERARLVTRLAYLEAPGCAARAIPLAREAARLARAAGDADALQDALYTLHFAIGGPDGLAERGRLCEEIACAAERSHSADRAVIALLDVACDRLELGDADGARRLRAEATRIARERPHLGMRWQMGVYDTGLALLEGRLSEVAQRALDTLSLGRRIEHPYAPGCCNTHHALLARERGDWAAVLERLEPVLRAREGPKHWVFAVVARGRLAAGRGEEARALFAQLAAQDFRDVPRNLRWTATLVEIAHLCADLGDAARAPGLVELLGPVEGHHGVLPMAICYGGPASFALARLADLLGRPDEAASLTAEALEASAALGARPMHARIAQHAAARRMR